MQFFFSRDNGKLKKTIIKCYVTTFLIIGIIVTILSLNDNVFGALLLSIGLVIGPFLWTSSVKENYFKYFLKEFKLQSNGIG
jgi:hypothetical protein